MDSMVNTIHNPISLLLKNFNNSSDESAIPVHHAYSMSALAVSDNGDIYVTRGWIPATGDGTVAKPSGLLRIKNNEENFDPDFFMDLDELTRAKCNGIALMLTAYH